MKAKARLGKLQVQIDGLNQVRLLNRLRVESVEWFDLVVLNQASMTLWVYKRDQKKAFAIFEKLCYNVTVVNHDLVSNLLQWSRQRVGILAGIILFSVVVFLSNNVVWRIEIAGLDSVPLNYIHNILRHNDINVGMWQSSVDKVSSKAQLLELDNVLDATLHMRGTTLVVTIFEDVNTTQPPELSDIVSKYDATVTRVVVTEGTPLVSPGEIVTVGASLISPNVYNINGEVLHTVRPQGAVYGTVALSTSRFFVLSELIPRDTGRTRVHNSINLFGWEIQRTIDNFALQRVHTSERMLLGRLLAPVLVRTTTLYEIEMIQVEHSLQDKQNRLVQEMEANLVLQVGGSVYSRHIDLRPYLNGYRLDVFVQAEIRLH